MRAGVASFWGRIEVSQARFSFRIGVARAQLSSGTPRPSRFQNHALKPRLCRQPWDRSYRFGMGITGGGVKIKAPVAGAGTVPAS